MAKKKTSFLKNQPILLIVAGIIALTAAFFFWNRQNLTPQLTQTPASPDDTTTYQSSDVLGFEIEVPITYTIRDRGFDVTLSKDGDEINIHRSGTDFDNLDDYLSNLDSYKKNKPKSENKVEIDGLNSARRMIEIQDSSDLLSYKIYINGLVYDISTTSPNLYSDLDQIAQSFRYTGEQAE